MTHRLTTVKCEECKRLNESCSDAALAYIDFCDWVPLGSDADTEEKTRLHSTMQDTVRALYKHQLDAHGWMKKYDRAA